MRGRRGFSLIVVLLVSLIGLVAVGAMMQIMEVNAGAGRTASTVNSAYNFLASEVEETRAVIIASLDQKEVPRRMGTESITAADDLLVWEDWRELEEEDMALYGLGGTSGAVTVKVYDMQYNVDTVSSELDEAEINHMPPSLNWLAGEAGPKDDMSQSEPGEYGGEGSPVDVGVYLIRASLEIDGVPSSTVDLAIVGTRSDDVSPD